MGLNIHTLNNDGEKVKDYARYGSYGRIHVLRRWVGNDYEKLEGDVYSDHNLIHTNFPALINHSDCDGGYLSFKAFGIIDTKDHVEWGDLDELKDELTLLKKHKKEMPEDIKDCFNDLYDIVFPKDENSVLVIFT